MYAIFVVFKKGKEFWFKKNAFIWNIIKKIYIYISFTHYNNVCHFLRTMYHARCVKETAYYTCIANMELLAVDKPALNCLK